MSHQHTAITVCLQTGSITFSAQICVSKWGEVMLPQDYHKQACRFFVRILQRLEERDVRNGENHSTHTAGRERKALAEREQQAGARPDAQRPTLPAGFDEGAVEKY